jgi:hypothetical protein
MNDRGLSRLEGPEIRNINFHLLVSVDICILIWDAVRMYFYGKYNFLIKKQIDESRRPVSSESSVT